jgi:ribosomal protein S6
MKQIAETNNYELMIVISSKYTENEIKNIAFNYAEQLQKLGAISINVVSRGRHNLSYKKKKNRNGYFVEIYFHSSPQLLSNYRAKLKIDKNIIRSLAFNLSRK